ncbi:MAG: hypothetical protein SFY69_06215 [Planctomycetota bacterium]|nr:hypothetical protein [Planctomycetota bacterium]
MSNTDTTQPGATKDLDTEAAIGAEIDALAQAAPGGGETRPDAIADDLTRQIEDILAEGPGQRGSIPADVSPEVLDEAAALAEEIGRLIHAGNGGGATDAPAPQERFAVAEGGGQEQPTAAEEGLPAFLPGAGSPRGAGAPAEPDAGAETAPPVTPPPAEPAAQVPETPPTPEPAPVPVPVPIAAPVPVAAPVPTPAPAAPEETPRARVTVEEVKPRAPRAVPGFLAAFARPLAKKSPFMRRAIALLGVHTLALGLFMWAYVLHLRPAPQHAHAGAFDFHAGDVPHVPDPPPKEAPAGDGHGGDDGHGAKKDAHAKDDGHGAKKDAHGAKKDSHAKAKAPPKGGAKAKKDESHGGGH